MSEFVSRIKAGIEVLKQSEGEAKRQRGPLADVEETWGDLAKGYLEDLNAQFEASRSPERYIDQLRRYLDHEPDTQEVLTFLEQVRDSNLRSMSRLYPDLFEEEEDWRAMTSYEIEAKLRPFLERTQEPPLDSIGMRDRHFIEHIETMLGVERIIQELEVARLEKRAA